MSETCEHGIAYARAVVDEPREVTLKDGSAATVRPIGWVEIGRVTSFMFTPVRRAAGEGRAHG